MTKKGVLILGSGKVASPAIQYFLQRKYNITIASEHLYQGEYLTQNNPLAEAVEWHSSDTRKLHHLVKNHQVVISLLPYQLHLDVCRACIAERTDLVTTSYQQPGMSDLHSEACKKNISIINEVGLDPGIDHMWAMQMIDTIKSDGGKIEKFISVCGALPAPESLDNPFRYKFSWNPEGVINASIADALFLKNGEKIKIKGSDILKNTFPVNVPEFGELEAYANRNSLLYTESYKIGDVKTFFRGTIRYKGWCETLASLIKVGYLSADIIPENITNYRDLTAHLFKVKKLNLRNEVALKLNLDTHSNSILAMEWLGLFSQVSFNPHHNSPIKALTYRMVSKMKMLPSDKDLIILNHMIEYETSDKKKQIVKGIFTMTGKNDERTAIAQTVSLPAAIVAELLLNKKIAHKGVIKPLHKEIYEPVLHKLKNEFRFNFSESKIEQKQWPLGW